MPMAGEATLQCVSCGHLQRVNVRDDGITPIFPFVCTRCISGAYRLPTATPLFCTMCAMPLKLLTVEQGEGANLGCEQGHKFYYSPAHLERGDILVIGELSFQCANAGPYVSLRNEFGRPGGNDVP